MQTAAESSARLNKIRKVLVWVMFGNIAVATAKILYGKISGSVSISADGLHSLTDSASNVVGLIALARAGDEADPEHPYGHHKMETAGALCIGFFIVLGLLEIAKSAYAALLHSRPLSIGNAGFGVVFGTLAVNALVTWQENLWGRRLNSPILLADARHTLSDSFATMGVLAAFVLARLGFPRADIFMAGLILVLVGRAAYLIFSQGIDVLLDRSRLDPAQIEAMVRSVPGVVDCHRVRSRGMAGAVFVDFHILVDSHLPIEQAHRITHDAEVAVRDRFPEVVDVVIHTEPASAGREPYPWEKR